MLFRTSIVPMLASALLVSAALVAPATQAQAAACGTSSSLTYASFPCVSSQDSITVSTDYTGNFSNETLCLQTASSVTWWKALVVRGYNGNVVAEIDTQDGNHGPTCVIVGTYQFTQIEFWKAKLFGIHTLMYTMSWANVVRPHGTDWIDTVWFDWTRDS